MFIPKRYGQSKIDKCPFCNRQGIILNKQKIPVCQAHKERVIGDMKCACGLTLEIKNGKFGVFFSCIKCGSMNMKKMLEINPIRKTIGEPVSQSNKIEAKNARMTTVRSDDPTYFD